MKITIHCTRCHGDSDVTETKILLEPLTVYSDTEEFLGGGVKATVYPGPLGWRCTHCDSAEVKILIELPVQVSS